MPHIIKIPHLGNPAGLIAKAGGKVALTGDHTAGTFAHMGVEGSYNVDPEHINLTITKKPMMLPGIVIEQALRKAM